MTMEYSFDNLFLASGKDFVIDEFIKVKHPKLYEIMELGTNCEKEYGAYVSAIASTRFEQKGVLWKMNIDYETIDSDFGMFCILFHTFTKLHQQGTLEDNVCSKALSFFLGKKDSEFVLFEENNSLIIIDKNYPRLVIDKHNFPLIQRFVRLINCLSLEEPPKPADKYVKEDMIEDDIFKMEHPDKEAVTLFDIVSSIAYGGNSIQSFEEVSKKPIFEIYTAIKRMGKRINYDLTIIGCYFSALNLPSTQIEKINWCGKL